MMRIDEQYYGFRQLTHMAKDGGNLNSADRKVLIQTLVQTYLIEKEQNQVSLRENSTAYSFATGKLIGACTAFKLDFEETENDVTVFTQSSKKIVCRMQK